MSPANSLTARAALRLLETRELSAAALLRDCLERIAEREPVIGAWACLAAEPALAAARELDAGAWRGPLHGLPLGVKDIIDTVDLPTAYGSPIYAGHRPAWDAACVAAARAAGGIVLGKTVTTEFATYHPGKTANPHNPAHTPGGSSSGSAAAVADGMVPLAYGTQTAGSVIRPAAFCGVVGFKPSFGLISRAGVKVLAGALDTIGVFARDVADAALFAGVCAGVDLGVPETSAPPRIGLCRGPHGDEAEPAARAVLEDAAARLSAAGAGVVDCTLPAAFAALSTAQTEIMAWEAARAFEYETRHHADALSPKLKSLIAQGAAIPFERHAANLAQAFECRRQFADVMRGCDALLTLSAAGEAPAGLAATGDPLFNRIWTLLGAPCVHLPIARGPRGLPLGVQMVGSESSDRATLAAAAWAFDVLGTDA